MSKSSLINDRIIPDGKFDCSLCQSKFYAPENQQKNISLSVNEALLDLIDTCDKFL